MAKPKSQLEREIKAALAKPVPKSRGSTTARPYRMPCECGSSDAYWHGPEGMREYMCDDCWRERHGGSGAKTRTGATVKRKAAVTRPTPYRLKLTPAELSAVEFAHGRYGWADMLATHAAEDGSIAFTESEMWQWCDDVDEDDGRFTLAAPGLVDKLESFYASRV